MRRVVCLIGLGTVLTFGLIGCGNGTGPEDTGYVSVSLSRAADGSASAATGVGMPAFDVLPVENIADFSVEVTAVEVHRVGNGEEQSGGEAQGSGEGEAGAEGSGPWIRIDLTPAGEEEIDMASLPQVDVVTSGFQVAVDALPAGTYNLLRLFFDGVSLGLLQDAMIDGVLYEAGTDLPLEIKVPSGEQTGILVQTGSFEVPAGGTAGILVTFDAENSLKNVSANANGISVTPVMSAKVQVTQTPPEGQS